MKKIISYIILMISACTGAPAQINPMEYPPGHPNFSAQPTAIEQLKGFPVPRYKNNHTMHPNFSWIDFLYFGGHKQPGVSDPTSFHQQAEIQRVLAGEFNYMINVTWFTSAYNDTCVKLANDNPQWKCGIVCLRAQVGGSKMWDQNFPKDHYLQDSQGRYIQWDCSTGSFKVWRPTAPVNDYAVDGDIIKSRFATSLSKLNRKVDIVNENGEVYPFLDNCSMDSDPVVNSARIASGLSRFQFLGKKIRENDNAYRDRFMSLPQLSNAKYTQYRLGGHREYQFSWEQTRFMTSPFNGQYYATEDMYVRWPYNWQSWISAWHGKKWMTQSMHYELLAGDKLRSSFIGAGWSANPEEDVRPAQWLGLCKMLGMYGNEFFYPGYFNEAGNYNPPNPPPNDPKGYAWQAVIPSYAQAVISHCEDLLRQGNVMAGDMIDNTNYNELHEITPIPHYQFYTGKSNYVVTGRKLGSKYVLSGTIQNSSNQTGSAPLEDVATITLDGQQLTFKIRRQGSTYIYDPQNKIFYQLDGWHESSHPSWWSKDIEIEAEVFDASTATIRSYYATPDLTNFKSVIALATNQNANYSFTNRAALNTLFIKASGNGNLETTLDGVIRTIPVKGEGWYKVDLGSLVSGNHALWLTALSNLEIDSISVTSNPNKYPTVITPPTECSIPQWVSSPVTNITSNSCLVWFKLVPQATSGYAFYIKNRLTGQVKTQQKNTNTSWDSRKHIAGLKPLTTYDITMVSKCEGGVLSPASSVITVTTK